MVPAEIRAERPMEREANDVEDLPMLFDLTQLAVAAVVSVLWVRRLQQEAALQPQPAP
jgi:hypothetical protein